jgi:hypothetical protein
LSFSRWEFRRSIRELSDFSKRDLEPEEELSRNTRRSRILSSSSRLMSRRIKKMERRRTNKLYSL